MGQSYSEAEGEFGCDSCGKTIETDRYRCKKCPNFDLCSKCVKEKKSAKNHSSSHRMIKIVDNFPEDCYSVIIFFVEQVDFVNLLILNRYFFKYLSNLDHPIFETYESDWKKLPRNPKNYIGRLSFFRDPFTPEIASKFPNLVYLKFNRVNDLKIVRESFPKIPKIKHFYLHQCYDYDGSGMEHWKNLKILQIHHKGSLLLFSEKVFENLSDSLEELKLHRVEIKDNVGKKFQHLSHITKLEMESCDVSDEDMKELMKGVGKSLKHLVLRRVINMDLSCLKSLDLLESILVTIQQGIRVEVLTRDDVVRNVPKKKRKSKKRKRDEEILDPRKSGKGKKRRRF